MKDINECPYCGEEVLAIAKKCKHCGEWLDKTANNDSMKSGTLKVDNSAKLENLYKVARRAREDGNTDQAYRKYEDLLTEDPDNWEPNFYTAYYSGINSLKNDNPGSSVRISGGQVSLGYNYRSGITPCITVIHNCIDRVFSLIEDIQDYDKQKEAIEAVYGDVKSVSSILTSIIDSEYQRMDGEISHYLTEVETQTYSTIKSMRSKNSGIRDSYKEDISNMLALVKKRKNHIEEVVGKRRFEEFWAANQPLKAELEAETRSLEKQISAFNAEIAAIPEKTDGYAEMIRLQEESKRLKEEKKKLGLFKIKDRKAVQVKINSANNAIVPIQSRIDSAIADVQKLILQLQERLNEINTELTRSR